MEICKAPTLRHKAHHAYHALSMHACTTIFVLVPWLQNPLKLGTRRHLNHALSMHTCISFCSRNVTSKSSEAWYRSIPTPYINHACMNYCFYSRNMNSKSTEAWYRPIPIPCIKHACVNYCFCSRNMTSKSNKAWYMSTPTASMHYCICSRKMTSKSTEVWYRSVPTPCIKHACMHYCFCSRNMTSKSSEAMMQVYTLYSYSMHGPSPLWSPFCSLQRLCRCWPGVTGSEHPVRCPSVCWPRVTLAAGCPPRPASPPSCWRRPCPGSPPLWGRQQDHHHHHHHHASLQLGSR